MFHTSTRVLIYDKGYIAIDDASKDDAYWNGSTMVVGNKKKKTDELVKITLVNGKSVVCSANTKFHVMEKRLGGVTLEKAGSLTERHLVYLCDEAPGFDAHKGSTGKYLSKLSSYEIGMLSAFFERAFEGPKAVEMAKSRKEAHRAFKALLDTCGVAYTVEEVERRVLRTMYRIDDDAFFEELKTYRCCNGFPEVFWTSKPMLEGFLKVLFTFGSFGGEMLIVKGQKDSKFLPDVQEALTLFGVNSAFIGGLMITKLIVSGNNAYNFASRIGIFNAEDLFGPLDYKRFLDYNPKQYSDGRYERVSSVKKLIGSGTCMKMGKGDIIVNGMLAQST